MDKTHLVIGAYGMVGSAICDELTIRGLSYHKFPKPFRIEDAEQVLSVFDYYKPGVVWLCAAYTNVTACETYEYAAVVNIDGVRNVCEAAHKHGSKVVFFSSSYVFNGNHNYPYKELDTPDPISMYGIHKMVGERIVQLLDDYCIIRTCAVYGHDVNRKSFPYYVIDQMNKYNHVIAAEDQLVAPIYVKDLAWRAFDVSEQSSRIYHINGPDALTKFEWAQDIKERFDLMGIVAPFCCDPIRPKNGVLRNSVYVCSYSSGMREFINDYKATNN